MSATFWRKFNFEILSIQAYAADYAKNILPSNHLMCTGCSNCELGLGKLSQQGNLTFNRHTFVSVFCQNSFPGTVCKNTIFGTLLAKGESMINLVEMEFCTSTSLL